MPIFSQTYRAYDGSHRRGFRWLIIVMQELRILFSSRYFLLLLLPALLHFSFRVFQIGIYDMLDMSIANPALVAMRNSMLMNVDKKMFFDFLRLQAPQVFLVFLYAGSGMICNDFQDNLIEIYFSKPITRRDYILGKLMTLITIGALITFIPASLLVLIHNLMAPGMETLKETWWLPLSIAAFSALIIMPCALCVLAASSSLSTRGNASMALFMVLLGDTIFGGIMYGLLRNPNIEIVAVPLAINNVGKALFSIRRISYDLHWAWPLLIILFVCAIALWLVTSKIRKAESAA